MKISSNWEAPIVLPSVFCYNGAVMSEKELADQVEAELEQTEPYPYSLDIVYAEIKDKLDIQIRQVDSLDNKTGNILFVASIVIGVGAAAQAALISMVANPVVLLLFSIPIIFYLLTILTAVRSWIVKPYFRDPEPRPLRDEYLFEKEQFTRRRLIAHFISTYEWNAAVLQKKVFELRLSTWFLLAETISLTTVLLLRAWLA